MDLEITGVDRICCSLGAILKGREQGWLLLVHLQEELSARLIHPHSLRKTLPAGQTAEHLNTRQLSRFTAQESLLESSRHDLGK